MPGSTPPKGVLPPKRKMHNMSMKRKALFLCLLVLTVCVFATACGEANPYDVNNQKNYTVSIRYDANGGSFTTNTTEIVDSYNISDLPKNSEGKVELPLIAPDDANRDKDGFAPAKSGYFLVGWYAERTESKDAAGNVTYTYAEPWDFEEDRLSVDPKASYSAHTPALTLYAAWAPLYEINFYDLSTGTLMETKVIDPTGGADALTVQVPAWDTETGAMNLYKFPNKDGYTFKNAFYDATGQQPINTETLTHPGTVDPNTAEVTNGSLDIYVDWTEGAWYRISTAEQFIRNFNLKGNYEILADLDFTDKIWPTAMMYGSFSGRIQGNGHSFSNVTFRQNDNAKVNAGLFGNLTAEAVLKDVTFQNVTFTVQKGARVTGASYGLLCGSLTEGAVLDSVTVLDSRLLIDSGCYFATEDYSIGLISGMGDGGVDYSGITCEATGSNPEKLRITVTDNTVTVEFL